MTVELPFQAVKEATEMNEMKAPIPRRTAATALSPQQDLTISPLGEDRCDVNHPTRLVMECALPFGHGAFHQCDPVEGESLIWMGRQRHTRRGF